VPTLDPAVLRKAANPVLTALGLADASVHVEPYGAVTADPVVDGLPTFGYATRLEFDAGGRLVGGNGFLGRPERGASYPLVSAAAALATLTSPQPQLGAPTCEGCPVPPPAVVTGAVLGLAWTPLVDEGAALLPAWLFTVTDWPMPLVQVAVQPRYLESPAPEPTSLPASVPPPVPGARAPLGFDAAYPSDNPKEVVVQYGDSGSCPHAHVTAAVKESADSVVVILEADAQPSEQACTADYRQMLVTVPLQQALGSRQVIDASRGEPVPVDRSCTRPFPQPPPTKDCTR
jgi:hypothetical protein